MSTPGETDTDFLLVGAFVAGLFCLTLINVKPKMDVTGSGRTEQAIRRPLTLTDRTGGWLELTPRAHRNMATGLEGEDPTFSLDTATIQTNASPRGGSGA